MDLKDCTQDELVRWLNARGHKSFRAQQILKWVYHHRLTDVGQMSNIPLALREELALHFQLTRLDCSRHTAAVDGTEKSLFTLTDGRRIESVFIPSENRRTLCISSQAGCAMGCQFCATARVRPVRNLTAGEIVSQVWEVQHRQPQHEAVTNVVFMGMGEPLANYDQVVKAITILTAAWGYQLSPRRITVSTVGLVPQMQRLLYETQVNLTISLSATTDAVRNTLMPINRRYPLVAVLDTCRSLSIAPRNRVTFAYTLLDGLNDSPADAKRLVSLLHGIRAKVNLIPFNSFPGAPFAPSSRERITRFRQILLDRGIYASIRESRGQDVQAACGQLAAPLEQAA
jgi:23S rRNA (adenine2503-C2)-methyltransferase